MIGEQQIIPYYSPITSKGGKGKKGGGDMKDAIAGTEAIRNWNDHKLSVS